MVSARIRGIYSTALTKLLLDSGFEIVQPSEPIIERFGLSRDERQHVKRDLEVHDRPDRQGVIVTGKARAVDRFINVLRPVLDDAIYRDPLLFRRDVELLCAAGPVPSSIILEDSDARPDPLIRMDVEFPGLSKGKLDEIRASVTPTVEGHHYYKACGGVISSMVDTAEMMLEEGCPRREVEALLEESVLSRLPKPGSRISLEHVKITGHHYDLGAAKIARFDRKNGRLILLRRILGKGVYDGLDVRKDPGDFAVTEMVMGEMSLRTRYFSADGEYKGSYINVNTPVELYPLKARYVDLEVDVCVWPSGEVRKIDHERLEEAVLKGLISERLLEISNEEVERLLNSISLEEEEEAHLLI